jgi:hypothetical protein
MVYLATISTHYCNFKVVLHTFPIIINLIHDFMQCQDIKICFPPYGRHSLPFFNLYFVLYEQQSSFKSLSSHVPQHAKSIKSWCNFYAFCICNHIACPLWFCRKQYCACGKVLRRMLSTL